LRLSLVLELVFPSSFSITGKFISFISFADEFSVYAEGAGTIKKS